MAIRSPFNCANKQIGEENCENQLRFDCLKIGNKVAVVDTLPVLDCVKNPTIPVEWKSCSNVTLEKRNNNPGLIDNTYVNTAITDFTRFGFPECKSVIGNEPWKYVPRKERTDAKDNDKRAVLKTYKSFKKFPTDVTAQNSKFNKYQKLIQKENAELLKSSYKNEESLNKTKNKLKSGEIPDFDQKYHLKSLSKEELEENEFENSKITETQNPTVINSQNEQSWDPNSNDKLRSNKTNESKVNEHSKTDFKENSKDKQHLKSKSKGTLLNNESIHNEYPTVPFTTLSDKKQPSINENDYGFDNNKNEEFTQKPNDDTNAELTSLTPYMQQQINSISERKNKSRDELVNGFSGQSLQKANDDTNGELTSLTPYKQQQINSISERKNKSHGELVNGFNEPSSQRTNDDTNAEFTSLVANNQQEKNVTSEGIIENEYMNKNDLESSKKLLDNDNKSTRINNTKNTEFNLNRNLNLINSFDFVNTTSRDYDKALKNPKNIYEKIKKESNRPELLTKKNPEYIKSDKHDNNRIYAKTNPTLDPSIRDNTKYITSDINNKSKIIKHIDFKASNPFDCIDINNRDRGNTPVDFILPPEFCQAQKKETQKPTQTKSLEKVKYIPITFCENSKM